MTIYLVFCMFDRTVWVHQGAFDLAPQPNTACANALDDAIWICNVQSWLLHNMCSM